MSDKIKIASLEQLRGLLVKHTDFEGRVDNDIIYDPYRYLVLDMPIESDSHTRTEILLLQKSEPNTPFQKPVLIRANPSSEGYLLRINSLGCPGFAACWSIRTSRRELRIYEENFPSEKIRTLGIPISESDVTIPLSLTNRRYFSIIGPQD